MWGVKRPTRFGWYATAWVLGFVAYKLLENWALSWITARVEPWASATVTALLSVLPLVTWLIAAAGLVWLTSRVAPKLKRPEDESATARRTRGGITAIAYLRSISMAQQRADEIQVHCAVAFYGLQRAKESPTELILKVPGVAESVICRLQLPRSPSVIERAEWATTAYWGSIGRRDSANLLRAVKRSMRDLPRQGPVFAEVEVSLSGGPALAMHTESGVQFGLPPGVGGPALAVVEIKNWADGVPERWRVTDDDEQPRGKTLIFSDPDGRRWFYEDLDALSDDEQRLVMKQRPDVWRAFLRETSDRMGPPGRPGAPWPEDLDASPWSYQELGGRHWRYRDVCSLPIPEREKLKREKPDVWAAYWAEACHRSEYVMPNGTRWTKAKLGSLSEEERHALWQRDPDLLEWYLHGEKF